MAELLAIKTSIKTPVNRESFASVQIVEGCLTRGHRLLSAFLRQSYEIIVRKLYLRKFALDVREPINENPARLGLFLFFFSSRLLAC